MGILMKGQILDVSIQSNTGVISGDDGNRYSFSGAAWNVSAAPRRGMRVDFDPDGSTAAGIYADSSPTPPAPSPARTPGRPTGAPASSTAATAVPTNASSAMGVAGMGIGLAALILFWVPILGWLLMMLGLGLSLTELVRSKKRGGYTGFPIAGIVLNSITLFIRTFIAVVVAIATGAFSRKINDIINDLGLGPVLDALSFF